MSQNIYERLEELKVKKKAIEADMLTCQVEIYTKHAAVFNTKDIGTVNAIDTDLGYKVTVVKGESVEVDHVKAAQVKFGFRAKYSLDSAVYKALTGVDKRAVDDCITTKPKKPTFKVEKI